MSLISQSKLFGHTRRDISVEETSINARLLIKAGFVEKSLAGVYSFLPLGLRVLKKIEAIIRQEMDSLGAQEMLLPALQNKEVWSQTGRWQNKVGGVMYQFKDSGGKDLGLGPTHEEVIVDLLKRHVRSYKDLPLYLYQIQNKFRDEPRSKSGLLRTREFLMKDLYAFTTSAEETASFYQRAHAAYLKIFQRVGLKAFSVEASGGTMSKKYSHEFMVITPAGEDLTVYCASCQWAQNKEIASAQAGDACPRCGKTLEMQKTVEAGNIFDQETLFTTAQEALFTAADGARRPINMSAYGIGVSRIMGTIVEASHDEHGIVWTPSVAPFQAHLILLADDTKVVATGLQLAQSISQNWEVLLDDRPMSVGQKLHDADLLGIPVQIIVGPKALPQIEWKLRRELSTSLVESAAIPDLLERFYAQTPIR